MPVCFRSLILIVLCIQVSNVGMAQDFFSSWPPIRNQILEYQNNGSDSALIMANTFLEESLANGNSEDVVDAYLIRADLFASQLLADKAMEDMKAAEKLVDKKNILQFLKLKMTYAWYYDTMNSLPEAAGAYNDAYIWASQYNDQNLLASLALNLGGILVNTNQIFLAKHYLKEGLNFRLRKQSTSKDSLNISRAYNSLGYACYFNGEFEEGAEHYLLSAKYVKNISLQRYFRSIVAAADCYTELKKIDKSDELFASLKEYPGILNLNNNNYINYQMNMARLMLAKGNADSAISYLTNAFDLIEAKNLGNKDEPDLLRYLHQAYLLKGDYKMAYSTLEQYSELKDSLHQVYTASQLERVAAQFHFDKTNLKIDDLSSELEKSKANADISKTLNRVGLGLLAIIGLFGLYYYLKKREKERYLKKLETKVKEAVADSENANDKLKITNSLLEGKNNEKSVLLREIHHRVKNNMQMIVSIIRVERKMDSSIDAEELLDKLESRIHSISEIHEKLYKPSGTDYKNIDAKEFFDDVSFQIFKVFSPQNKGDFKLNVDVKSFSLPFDKVIQLGIILNELFANTFKYGFLNAKEGVVDIQLKPNGDNRALFTYKDNGCGFPEKSLSKDDDSAGFGKQIVDLLIYQLSGETTRYNDNGAVIEIDFVILD